MKCSINLSFFFKQRFKAQPIFDGAGSSDSWICSIGQVSEFLANFKCLNNILKNLENEEIPNPENFFSEMINCFSKFCDESKILRGSLIKTESNFLR